LNGAQQSVEVISARIFAKFELSLYPEAISIAQAPVHDPVEKIETRHALLRSLFLPCILFVAPVADELAR
jgi:hypothetical protein